MMDEFLREYGPVLVPTFLLTVSEVLSHSRFKSNGIVHFVSLFLQKWMGGKK